MKEKPSLLRRLLRGLGTLALALVIITAVDIYRWPDSRGLQALPLVTTDGTPLDLQHTDRPVFIYFWATWCGICRHTSPAVDKLSRQGIPVIGVALRSGSDEEVGAYLKTHGWQFDTVNDADGVWSGQWQVRVTPTIVLVKNGRVRHSTTGLSGYWGLRARIGFLDLLDS